jgi:DNA polymerase delta subunit 1
MYSIWFFNGQRDAATAPNVGDRVPYVIIKAAKGAKVI